MTAVPPAQVFLLVAALLVLLPLSGSQSSSEPGDFLENFLSQSHNTSVWSAFFPAADGEAENNGTGLERLFPILNKIF